MKKALSLFIVAAAATAVVFGCTKGYEAKKTAGEVTLALGAAGYPLVKGDNALIVKVSDASGKTITDANVSVRYYMPAMPGMAAMEYTAQATPKGDSYAFTADIPMEGGWKVEVTAARPGNPPAAAVFNVDAR